MLYDVGTRFEFTNNDFSNPTITTSAERQPLRVEPETDAGYLPGTRIIFFHFIDSLQVLKITRPTVGFAV